MDLRICCFSSCCDIRYSYCG